jgi:hypothetical protein
MHIRGVLVSTAVLTLLAAGCATKEPAPAPTESAPSTASAVPSTASAAPPTETVAEPTTCPPQDGNQITINGDGISCADANSIAAKYDLQGEKYQEIDSAGTWTCYTGNAESRPMIFQCVSGLATDFSVYPAS